MTLGEFESTSFKHKAKDCVFEATPLNLDDN